MAWTIDPHRPMRILIIPLALGLAASPAAAQDTLPVRRDPQGVAARLDAHVRRLVPFGFSGSVLVAVDGAPVLARGYGMADREAGIPVTPETVFDVGSITKQFTAAAILKLQDEGKLRVTDPVSRWLPGVPADRAGMTLHHLLTHSAGLDDTFGGDYQVAERDSTVAVILGSELLWAPGTQYRYSNAGYTLLAAIVEAASGMPYERYLQARLFAPAGMTRTGYMAPEWRPGELAVGYRAGERWGTPTDHRWAPDGPYWNLRGNGGILSTPFDLLRWHNALAGDAILSDSARRAMWTPHVPEDPEGSSHYGYGWAIFSTARGGTLIAHNGGNGVFFADFRRYVDDGVTVIVMSNQSDFSAERLLPALGAAVFGGRAMPPSAPAAVAPPADAASRAGTYRLPSGATVAVEWRYGTLRMRPDGQAAFAALAGGAPSPALEALGQRIAEAFNAAQRGDIAPLHQAFGDDAPAPERLREMQAEFIAMRAERLGAFTGAEPVGTSGDPAGRAATVLRLRFARGDQLVRIAWGRGNVVGIGAVGSMPATVFAPVEGGGWASYDLSTGASVRARWDGGTLVLETDAGPVRAERVDG